MRLRDWGAMLFLLTMVACGGCKSEFCHDEFMNTWHGKTYEYGDGFGEWAIRYGNMCIYFDEEAREVYINSENHGAETPYDFSVVDEDTLKMAWGLIQIEIEPLEGDEEWLATLTADWPLDAYDGTVLDLSPCEFPELTEFPEA